MEPIFYQIIKNNCVTHLNLKLKNQFITDLFALLELDKNRIQEALSNDTYRKQ